MSRPEEYPARTYDDLLLRNRALIEQAEAAVADVRRLAKTCADLSERTRARSLLLHQQSSEISARLLKIRAGTEDRCRRSRQAYAESGAAALDPGAP